MESSKQTAVDIIKKSIHFYSFGHYMSAIQNYCETLKDSTAYTDKRQRAWKLKRRKKNTKYSRKRANINTTKSTTTNYKEQFGQWKWMILKSIILWLSDFSFGWFVKLKTNLIFIGYYCFSMYITTWQKNLFKQGMWRKHCTQFVCKMCETFF